MTRNLLMVIAVTPMRSFMEIVADFLNVGRGTLIIEDSEGRSNYVLLRGYLEGLSSDEDFRRLIHGDASILLSLLKIAKSVEIGKGTEPSDGFIIKLKDNRHCNALIITIKQASQTFMSAIVDFLKHLRDLVEHSYVMFLKNQGRWGILILSIHRDSSHLLQHIIKPILTIYSHNRDSLLLTFVKNEHFTNVISDILLRGDLRHYTWKAPIGPLLEILTHAILPDIDSLRRESLDKTPSKQQKRIEPHSMCTIDKMNYPRRFRVNNFDIYFEDTLERPTNSKICAILSRISDNLWRLMDPIFGVFEEFLIPELLLVLERSREENTAG